MTIRIGTNPIAWSNDDMQELGRATSLETCLREAKAAGYTGIELGHKFPREAGPLAEIMKPSGLDIVSGWYSSFLLERSVAEEIECLQNHMALLKVMGCKVIVWAECTGAIHGDLNIPLSQRPVMDMDAWGIFTQKLTEIANYLESQNMKMAYHHHMGTVIETQQDINQLMEMTGDNVGLLLDTGHISLAGGDPLQVMKDYKSRITHFHAKDIRPDIAGRVLEHDKSFLNGVVEGVFTVPGDGSIDYLPLFRELYDIGYEGWIVVEAEQDPEKAHPFTYAKKGYAYLEQTLKESGFEIDNGEET